MDNDIAARLRDLKNAMNECGFTGISAVTNAAADEIERLRAERDEARREICILRSSSTNATEKISAEMEEYARSRGWECFEEVNK